MEQETELRALVPDAGRGRRTVDALLQVTKSSGDPGLIHIEVQSQNAAHFEERIFLYFSRLRDKKFRPVCKVSPRIARPLPNGGPGLYPWISRDAPWTSGFPSPNC